MKLKTQIIGFSMKSCLLYSVLLPAMLISAGCSKNAVDIQKPEIHLDIDGAFPRNCDTIYFDRPFVIRMLLSDNVQLGAYSISFHHNFDHHSHTTEINACELEPLKNPVRPYTYINDFLIPDGLSNYEIELPMLIPSRTTEGLFDDGDYHFYISVTDKEGWTTQKGLSIKLRYPEP